MIIYDCEVFPNYFSAVFFSYEKKKFFSASIFNGKADFNPDKLSAFLASDCFIGFNNKKYDDSILSFVLSNQKNEDIYIASRGIISGSFFQKCESAVKNSIDLMPLIPLGAGLKVCEGRLNFENLQDLPYAPDRVLSEAEKEEVKKYCKNDVAATLRLFEFLKPELEIRKNISAKYRFDFRSSSEPQIAEKILVSEILKYGTFVKKESGEEKYLYTAPDYIKFKNPFLHILKKIYETNPFCFSEKTIKFFFSEKKETKLNFFFGKTEYAAGIGGLHSCEKSQGIRADAEHYLIDADVASFYPNIILNCGFAPSSIPSFLPVYEKIVKQRLEAKRSGDKSLADVLKIVINSSFGKFGNRYSSLYSPELLVNVTVTGQLSLLMLIEKMEKSGISVISANTDGIVCFFEKSKYAEFCRISQNWERLTGLTLEFSEYSAIYSKDVNNYIAIKKDGSLKTKGEYADIRQRFNALRKNPAGFVSVLAVYEFLKNGKDIGEFIRNHSNIYDFLFLKRSKNGIYSAEGVPLGKTIRFFKNRKAAAGFYTSTAGTDVARIPLSENSELLQKITDTDAKNYDIDFDFYIEKAKEMLEDIGYFDKPKQTDLLEGL